MSRKMKYNEIPTIREQLLVENNRCCALCGLPVPDGKGVLDHDHKTGSIRGALHRGCNSLLGKLENNYKRYGVDLKMFSLGLSKYLEDNESDQYGLIHPTHKIK